MASWRVTRDTPDAYNYDGAGNPVPGHVISFVTGSNFPGSVFVPNEHYNPNAVRGLINAEAAKVDEINTLTSE